VALRAVVNVRTQTLSVFRGQRFVTRYPISTAALGVGNREASYRTPLGRHRVHRKFGAGAPLGTVFRSRVNTRTVAPILTDPVDVEEDLILTRILWLDGLEPGLNKGPGIDSRERFIYIHGTNEEGLIGTPASHGCIRMRNRDVVALFDLLPRGAEVEIVSGG
jgi:lipoprotein-anchoring transpeptidase ErfK/SrfK